MQAPYFPDWRSVYHSEHLLGILSNNSWNMFSGYIPVAIDTIFKKKSYWTRNIGSNYSSRYTLKCEHYCCLCHCTSNEAFQCFLSIRVYNIWTMGMDY